MDTFGLRWFVNAGVVQVDEMDVEDCRSFGRRSLMMQVWSWKTEQEEEAGKGWNVMCLYVYLFIKRWLNG